jgi:hypothetical protein
VPTQHNTPRDRLLVITFAPQEFHHHLLGVRLRKRRCLWRERGGWWCRWPCACGGRGRLMLLLSLPALRRSPRSLDAGVGRGEGVREGRRYGERMLRMCRTLRRGALRRRCWCEATRRPLRRVGRPLRRVAWRWRPSCPGRRCMYRVRTHLGEGHSREQVRLRRRRRAWLRWRWSRARSKGCVGLHDRPFIEQPCARSQRAASQPCRRPGASRG